MRAVQDVLGGCAVPEPATMRSGLVPVPGATDAKVTLRSLAEQLVCEANAVLADVGDVVALDDQCGPGALAFTLTFRNRSAEVRTVMSGRCAQARLLVGGEPASGPRRLADEGQLRALVLTLIGQGAVRQRTAGAARAV
jgi:hypothetical protein